MDTKIFYHCFECVDEEFGSVDQLEVHIAKEHYNFYPFKCENCNIKFSTKWEIQRHFLRFHKNDDFVCKQNKITGKTLEIEKKIKELIDKSINRSKICNVTKSNIPRKYSRKAPIEKVDVEPKRKRKSKETPPEPVKQKKQRSELVKQKNDDSDEITIIEPPSNNVIQIKKNIVTVNNNEKDKTTSSKNSNLHVDSETTEGTNGSNSSLDDLVFSINLDEASAISSKKQKESSKSSKNTKNSSSSSKKQTTEKENLIDDEDDDIEDDDNADDEDDNKRDKKIKCPDCNKWISSRRSNIYHHVSYSHVRKIMFQCKLCEFSCVSFRRDKVSRHAKKHKLSIDECMIDCRPKNYPLVVQKTVEFFGEHMNMKRRRRS